MENHGGNGFTDTSTLTVEGEGSYSKTIAIPVDGHHATNGWVKIELSPGAESTVALDNITITKTAFPTCSEGEILNTTTYTCEVDNSSSIPTWFDIWNILTAPAGNKTVNDLTFTETGYSVDLAAGERTGIEQLNIDFEPGFLYELSFDYSDTAAGRLIWIQMENHGGNGFTDTSTLTVEGDGSFSKKILVPVGGHHATNGWVKIELSPGAESTVALDNITITKTALPTCGDGEVLNTDTMLCEVEVIGFNNPNFETGDTTGWLTWGGVETGTVTEGKLSVVTTAGGVWDAGLKQTVGDTQTNFGMIAEKMYEFTFEVQSSEATSIFVQIINPGGAMYEQTFLLDGTEQTFSTNIITTAAFNPGGVVFAIGFGPANGTVTVGSFNIIESDIPTCNAGEILDASTGTCTLLSFEAFDAGITDGDFTTSTGWSTHTSVGDTFDFTNGDASVTKVGKASMWDSQLYHENLSFESGYIYKITFEVTGTAGQRFFAKIEPHGVAESWFDLDGTTQTFTLTYEPTVTMTNFKFIFALGEMDVSSTITFDNVVIERAAK